MSEKPSANHSEAIRIENLTHRFQTRVALDDVSFTVARGSIHGFVGPNGAGKTTTLKTVATLLAPQSGDVWVFGRNVRRDVNAVRRTLGYMPDHFALYPQMTVREYLDFFGAAYGQSVGWRRKTVRDVLALTDMTGRAESVIRSLSRGMQQRVSLARVLVHDPDLLLLDEPASGLDPRARVELMEILRELVAMGKTVFISSHILSELATLCDSVTIIDGGRIRYSGPMEDLLTRTDGDHAEFVLQTMAPAAEIAAAIAALPGVLAVVPSERNPRECTIRCATGAAGPRAILEAVLQRGGDVLSFHRNRRLLDQAFLDLTEPGVPS